jgi:lipopolysaccharide/colanic/teichoic acid biosynthesis glycosyltransferase
MEEERQAQGPSLTRTGDRRVTKVGAVLRKYKLDEIPQFLNVLRGDMSIVGPRPKLPHLEIMHMPFRPGLTGAATLAFRREEEMLQHIPEHELEIFYTHSIKPLKAHIDWTYMQQSTLKTDLALMLRTVVVCMGMRSEEIPDVLTHVPQASMSSARSAGD